RPNAIGRRHLHGTDGQPTDLARGRSAPGHGTMTLRGSVKTAAFWIATAAVAPLLASYCLRAASPGRDRALEGSSATRSLIRGITGQYLRRAFSRRVLAACHPSVTIEFGALFSQAGARLDAHAYVGPRCHLGLVHVERDVLLGAGVHIPSGP